MCAGVDFSSGTFDKLYLYACAMSTTPHGLIQISGRVRCIRSDIVMCCASKSVPLVSTASKVTVDEQLQYLRWCGELSLTLVETRVESETTRPRRYFLPPCDASTYLLAANSARIYNAQTRFFAELKALLEQTGHVVRVEALEWRDFDMTDIDVEDARQKLLQASDITQEEYGDMVNKRVRGQSGQDDKWAVARHMYKHVWGIRTITEEFMSANGVRAGNNQVSPCPNTDNKGYINVPAVDTWNADMRLIACMCHVGEDTLEDARATRWAIQRYASRRESVAAAGTSEGHHGARSDIRA